VERQPQAQAELARAQAIVNAPILVAEGGETPMTKALARVGRPVARVADGLCHSRDRRRHIRQFHRVTRVTLRIK
jgi:hypothetical protein